MESNKLPRWQIAILLALVLLCLGQIGWIIWWITGKADSGWNGYFAAFLLVIADLVLIRQFLIRIDLGGKFALQSLVEQVPDFCLMALLTSTPLWWFGGRNSPRDFFLTELPEVILFFGALAVGVKFYKSWRISFRESDLAKALRGHVYLVFIKVVVVFAGTSQVFVFCDQLLEALVKRDQSVVHQAVGLFLYLVFWVGILLKAFVAVHPESKENSNFLTTVVSGGLLSGVVTFLFTYISGGDPSQVMPWVESEFVFAALAFLIYFRATFQFQRIDGARL